MKSIASFFSFHFPLFIIFINDLGIILLICFLREFSFIFLLILFTLFILLFTFFTLFILLFILILFTLLLFTFNSESIRLNSFSIFLTIV